MQPNQEFEGDMADKSETHFKRLYFLMSYFILEKLKQEKLFSKRNRIAPSKQPQTTIPITAGY